MNQRQMFRTIQFSATAAVLLLAFNNCGQVASVSQTAASQSASGTVTTPVLPGTPTSTPNPSDPAPTASAKQIQNSSGGANLCLETLSGALAVGACDATDANQMYALAVHDDGSVSLKASAKNECVEINAAALMSGTGLSVKTCAVSPSQNFSLLYASASSYRLISQVNGACLTVNASMKSIALARCDLSSSQVFAFASSAVAAYAFSPSLEKPVTASVGPALPKSFKGIHLGGAESGNLTDKNKYGYTYAYPSNALIDYVARKGFSLIRLSFRSGRLQPLRDGALDPVEFARLDKVVQYANSKGLYVLLDPHDYGSLSSGAAGSKKIGSVDMPAPKFANFWAHVAAAYVNQPNIIFGLMNEPFGINAKTWQSSAISAVSAIRSVGAKQLIFIPGVSWTGAHSWVSSGNAAVWENFKEQNYAFEIHQYFDSDSSGTNATCSVGVGAKRFGGFTAWAEANHQRGFLGEFGWGANAGCATEAQAALEHMDSHASAYFGWSYFGAGWYNGFMTVNPANLGKANEADTAQLSLIKGHL